MVFCKEDNRALLQALKNLVQSDREAGEYVPPNFDSILQRLDEMSAEIDDLVVPNLSADIRTTYSPGREEFEILQAYNSLIKAGGRPICPLSETASISKHPRRHLELLGPWVKAPLADLAIDWKGIFEKQLSNWQHFKAWQQSNRESEALPDTDTPETLLQAASDGANRPLSSSCYSSGSKKFEAHLAMARRRLNHCGFTKCFTFDMDLGRQDEWTTWIEYLSFECYCCDAHSRSHFKPTSVNDLESAISLDYVSSLVEKELTSMHYGIDGYSRDGTSTRHHANNCDSPMNSPQEAQYDTHASRKDEYGADEGAASKVDGIRPWLGGLISSGVGVTHDGTGTATGEPNDTNHHNLILRWALLQEPQIAAKSATSQGRISGTGKPWPTTHSPRRKRHWDGSLCSKRPGVFQSEGLGKNNDGGDPEHKRSRNSI
ncbi:hypothetical protein H634G_08955 [Metarhizium anisopliae BRIP 53293]|uniref:Uncharacterized protein n=1 Tax=Metarhizium anisopliae BRIP 53293 TaxID=1291518 RepID=A0A0D9NNZ2_METAN|nr:hypothetical protein H634G_08955 [Metarhizium anisopliae BRIP 53293]KJK88477.1 hypothetical protein H633G_07637 [Metarhizium anisopliae BRIP 53284]